jgi:outer membrane protein OmpA-like peptidoglycan-associated protein
MKKIILSFLAFALIINSFAQEDYKKLPSLGLHLFFTDFKTAAELRNGGLATVIRNKDWTKTSRMTAGLALSYMEGLSNHIDFVATASGFFADYPVPNKASTGIKFLLDVTAAANLKLLSDKYAVSPYLSLGAGVSKAGGYYGAFIPAGVGLQINIFDESFIMLNSQYRIPVTENVAYHLYHSIGFAGALKKRKVPVVVPLPAPPVEEPKDRDKDGVLDVNDKCPDVAGIASLQGCPDRDGDGIIDSDDKCPDVAGLAKYQGCPVPDTDKDGINDENDKCIDVPGFARYQGCPIPDTDGDGVNDEEDKCPTEKGLAENHGCPVLADYSFNADNVQFLTGSANLTAKAKAELNKGVAILTEHSALNVAINGYTDNVGKAATNLILSQKRADAAKMYLIAKGISASRIIAKGFGVENPIADNKTAAGRAKNRRVEFKGNN